MSGRLYYTDSYLSQFEARVVELADGGRRVYLDRTAFYPESGGQPPDRGTLASIEVVDVVDEGERIAHVLAAPLAGEAVEGRIDWARRFDHMQQHSGQHLLSSVLVERFGLETVSFHLGAEASTIDIAAGSFTGEQLAEAERRANEAVFENRRFTVEFQAAPEAAGLRKPSGREGDLRIVSIEGLDRSACGGTHVRATGEIGLVLLRKTEKIRGNTRIEFLCGGRAVRRARADFEALSLVARTFSSTLDDAPALVAAQSEKLQEADRARRKLSTELALLEGRALWERTPAGADGVRRHVRRIEKGAIDDDLRTLAQGFTAREHAEFIAVIAEPAAVLFAVSKDGRNAGAVLKPLLTAEGGRGGGAQTLAQGSVPDRAALERVAAALLA